MNFEDFFEKQERKVLIRYDGVMVDGRVLNKSAEEGMEELRLYLPGWNRRVWG